MNAVICKDLLPTLFGCALFSDRDNNNITPKKYIYIWGASERPGVHAQSLNKEQPNQGLLSLTESVQFKNLNTIIRCVVWRKCGWSSLPP